MRDKISSELIEAYSLCPRKAFLLMTGATANPGPHDYEVVIREQAEANRQAHCFRLAEAGEVVPFGGLAELAAGREVVADAELTADGLHARCDFLTKVNEPSRLGRFSYEPVKVIGTCRASRTDTLGLAYQGLVLGEVQGRLPASGTLVLLGDRPSKVKLAGKYKEVRRIVDALRAWAGNPAGDAPPVVLNKHCPSCPFRDACLQQAEKEDNLSLLDRMTPKLMRKYHDKGIFTIRQLSHIYKPRRSRKKAKRQVRHSLELQALAIRTGKVHVEHLPELPRGPVELFVDLEGVPDRDDYYLAGLLVCRGGEAEYESFWADDATGEAAMWSALVERLEAFPDSPVYHYGSYEKKAFATLAKRHGRGGGLSDRLVNVASSVYGKVYFPVRSNGLKPLGRFLGAAWTDPQASGLQSLVWRHRWEVTRDERFRQSLLQYNREDCEAVRLLVDRLDQIRRDAASDPTDRVRQPAEAARDRNREGGPRAVRADLASPHKMAYAERGIRIRENGSTEADVRRSRKAGKGHPGLPPDRSEGQPDGVSWNPGSDAQRHDVALVPKPNKTGREDGHRPRLHQERVQKDGHAVRRDKSRCPKCRKHYNRRPSFRGQHSHALRAWLPGLGGLPEGRPSPALPNHRPGDGAPLRRRGLASSTIVNFLRNLAGYYAPTEAAILQAILKSDFVHVDETKINIQGVDHYVWVFTDGKHVVFRMTETREADIVREVLAGYQGVLVSDFYPGYDGDPVPTTEMPRPPHPRHQRRPLEGSVRQGVGGVRRGGPGPARADPGGG